MLNDYFIREHRLVLRDSPQAIDFHIRSGDYFLFLATIMGFIEEALETDNEELLQVHLKRIRELRTDLRYIHANYKIVSRPLEDTQFIRPKGNLLRR